MAKVEAGRSILRVSCILAAVSALAVAGIAALYERQEREFHRQDERGDALSAVSVVRSQLQSAIDTDMQVLQGLVGVIEYEPGLSPAGFERLAARVTRGREGLPAVAATTDLAVTMAYPAAETALIGPELLSGEQARQSATLARALGSTVMSGPVVFGNGAAGFVARSPVFVDAEEGRAFWGIVSLAIDKAALFRAGGLVDADIPVDVLVIARDEAHQRPIPIFGDPALLEQEPVRTEVALPVGHWTLAAVPKGGWTEARLWPQRLSFGLAGLLVVLPILGAGRLVASRQTRLAETRAREADLSRLSWRLDFALAASNVGVWDVDIATDRLLWDTRARTLFGFPEREGYFSEADWIGAVHPGDRSRALAEARQAANGQGRYVSAYRIVRPDGAVRHIRDVAGHYVDADGVSRMAGLIWDVTEDVEREAELDMRRREAEAATDAKSRFLAAMSHEIRTPTTGVLGLLGLMLEEPLPERQRERATIALVSAQNLLELLNDILDFSKLEAGQITILAESVAIRALVAEVIELMAPTASKKGLALGHEVGAQVPDCLEVDPIRVRQVLTNLVSNAIKFTDRGEVRVSVGYDRVRGGGTISVAVEDTGIGIAPEQQERVFERFVQADTSLSRRAGGTGLGLAICRQLVERMGGRIELTSVPGIGSRFAFSLPAPEVRTEAGPAPALPSVGAESTPMHVLLAEDNPTNQYLLRAYLRSAGHSVEVVANGVEAVAAAASGAFDAVLMDVQMPELDGLAATRQIRELAGPAGEVPIIALTANALARDRDACLAAGMTDFLVKPIDVAALHRALARARASAPVAEWRQSAAGI